MIITPVVIGANYGDEGKGLITDFEVRRTSADTVIRFNGGAQAGHTVVTDHGSHVFGHIGSGTFSGASTYLSEYFIVNPMALKKELLAFGTKYPVNIHVHEYAIVTTIYDMVINMLIEINRGSNAHGSCGLGINETVTRSETKTAIYARDLNNVHFVKRALQTIQEEWVPARLSELGITTIPEPYASVLANTDFYLIASEMCNSGIKLGFPGNNTHSVFEGAQGLALDQFIGAFPHVTRSVTGLPYAIRTASDHGITNLQPIYVTRTYLTRHGNGPLPLEECADINLPADLTNVSNQWQGKFRHAPLDVNGLQSRINEDVLRSKYIAQLFNVNVLAPTLALTCLDQTSDSVVVNYNNELIRVSNIVEFLENTIGIHVSHVSHGRTANDVKFIPRNY